jgi:hypothetical protein
MKKIATIFISIMLFLLSSTPLPVQAEIRDLNTLNRDYEPFLMTGEQFEADSEKVINDVFIGVPFNQLYAFAYHAATDQWVEIPIQFDECDPNGQFIFTSGGKDNILYATDHVSVMCADLGDKVSENTWINNFQSRNYARYEVRGRDPITGEEGWFYLYRTSTYEPVTQKDYIAVEQNTHKVYSDVYTIGHNNKGVIVHISYPTIRGLQDESLDLIDRQKVRMKGSAFNIDYNETEDKVNLTSYAYVDGQIRVIQKLAWQITISSWFGSIDVPIDVTRIYYQNSVASLGTQELKSEFGCDLFRYSIDINQTMSDAGALFYNAYNSAIVLDQVWSQTVNTTINLPGTFWALVTSDLGSILQTDYIKNKIGSVHRLYFCERDYGTADYSDLGNFTGTPETGDGVSWGDIGVMHRGSVRGTVNLGVDVYLFKDRVDSAFGAQIAQNNSSPVVWWSGITPQNYDGNKPASPQISIAERGDEFITLSWIAPGDDYDGNGPVSLYEIHYSTTPAQFPNDFWWENQSTPIPNPPKPKEPGTTQQVTISGLERGTAYHFAARAKDDAGNWSTYSNMVTAITTPVELATFDYKLVANGVRLNWRTVSETNNYGFEIERKADDATDFTKIGFVKGFGTTNRPQSYTFIDKNVAAGQFEYRLKQIDQDGQFMYSQSLQVELTGPADFALNQNYPNPFNSETTISFALKTMNSPNSAASQEYDVEITVFNILGQKVRTLLSEQKSAGRYAIKWDGRDELDQQVSGGMYFYRILVKSAYDGQFLWTRMNKMILMP